MINVVSEQTSELEILFKETEWGLFLVACYTTLNPAMSVRWLVGRSPFYFFGVFDLFELTAPAQIL